MARQQTKTSRRVRRLTTSTLAATAVATLGAGAVMAESHDKATTAAPAAAATTTATTAAPVATQSSTVTAAASSTSTPSTTTRAS